MKVLVVGTDPGALCSALALDRDGHQVLVVGCHGGPQSGYERADLSVLKRGGILGDQDVPDAFDRQIRHRRVRFAAGSSRSGFSFDPEGSLPTPFRREELREWLLRELRSTDVTLRPTQEATGLLRPDRTVVGITTTTDDITADVVYLSENGFAWLTRNEQYGSSLPGDEPPHIVNIQASFALPAAEERSGSLDEFLQPRTVTTLLRPASNGDDSSPPLAQVFAVRDRCVVDLYLTRAALRARDASPATLMDDVLGRSPLRELPTSEDATLNLRLQPLGGWSRRATLCDHGLAVGGAGAGFINLWPDFDTVGPSLRSGYQFARTITHLDRQGKFPGRGRLREFYERPLSQGRLGREMRSDEPIAQRFEHADSLTASRDLEELELPGPSSVPSVRSVFHHLRSLNVPSLKNFLPGDWIGELEDLLRRVITNRINPFSGSAGLRFQEGEDTSRTASLAVRLTGRLWKRCHRLPEEPSAPNARTKILPYFLEALDVLTGSASRISPETPPVREYRMSEQSGPKTTPRIHATVQNSLQADLDPYQEIQQHCPADVFELSSNEHDQTEFEWKGEDCVHCGLCRFGSPTIDFYGSDASPAASDKLPRAFQTSVRDLFAGPDSFQAEDGRDGLGTVRRRLDHILESLRDEAFLTPESRDWIDGQLNLIRSDLRDVEEPETGRNFVEYVREEIGWIRRLLSREQFRFAYEKLRTLQRYHRELTAYGNGESTPSPEPSWPGSKDDNSDARTAPTRDRMHRVAREFHESLRSRMQERLPSTKEIQRDWSVGFLRPGRSDRISTLVDGEIDRILLNTEFGPRIFTPPEQPSSVPVQLSADLRVHWYNRNDLQPVESDGFVPDDFSVTVAPFLVDYFDFYRRLIGLSSGDIVESTAEPLNLMFGQRRALTHQLELLKNQESAESEQPKLPVVGRLLAGTDAVVESLYGSGSTSPADPYETSDDIASLIRALSGSPGDLVREQGSDGISEDLVDQLSLSEEEQQRWETADTSGIIHDSVRQWRTTLGVLRGLSRNDEGSDLQRLLFLVRTGTTRRAIGTLQEELDRGESPRLSSLSLKVLMKRLFWARQPFENPDLADANPLERKTTTRSDQPPPTDTMNELILGVRADVRSIDTSGIFSDLMSYLRTVLEELQAERIPGDSLVRELSLLLGEFREILEPELRRVATAGTGPDELLVLGPLLRWLNRFCSRMDELNSGRNQGISVDSFLSGLEVYRELGIHFWKGLRTEPLRERVVSRTEQYRNNFPFDKTSVLEERTRETLHRSLELFVSDLGRRSNLVGLWSEYVRLIGRMQSIDRTLENGKNSATLRIELQERLNQDVQNRSKLFNHGVRELRNDREPPASQILDLIDPSSIFPRRHTGEV